MRSVALLLMTLAAACEPTPTPDDDDLELAQANLESIQTVLELTGHWTDGSPRSAIISRSGNAITVDMSAFNRVPAPGSVTSASTIRVTFPDDATYVATLVAPGLIRWSNGSTWRKIINTAFDLNGAWTDGSSRRAHIFEGPSAIVIDMSEYGRPAAQGSIINASTIAITFPDDATYVGTLEAPNRIRWSNGSSWVRP